MALVTFNPWGVVQVKIHRIIAREMLLFRVKGGQGHHAAHNAPPVATMMNGSLPSHIAPALHFVWEPIWHFIISTKNKELGIKMKLKQRLHS